MDQSQKEKEFEKAIEDFGGIITKICFYFSSGDEEFKDLRQEVLYNIWKGWDDFRSESKLSTWVYRVCFNTCVSYNRKESIRNKTVPLDSILSLPAENHSNLLMKYKSMIGLIKQLCYTDRAIVLMWLDEKTYDEIAELMGISRNNVAVKLKRIKDKLVKMSKDIYSYE